MTHCYRKYKFQPFTETFSLLPYSLCWMTCLDSYALPHLMLENTQLVGYQYWFYALYCQHYERCNVMDTFHLSPWVGRLRGCYARTSHSSIVFCLLTSFCCWLPVPFREFWLRFMIGSFLYGTWSQGLQSLPCLSSWATFLHVYVSYLKVLGQTLRRNRRYIHYFQTNFIL